MSRSCATRSITRRWRADMILAADSPLADLDSLDVRAMDRLAVRIFRWLVAPTRQLPIGMTLAQAAGGDLDEFTDHAGRILGGFAAGAEDHGARYVLWWMAAHGGLACPHWWGTPTWPVLVGDFLQALDDPHHPHWGPDGSWRTRLSPTPRQVAERHWLRPTLLYRPWELEPGAAQWIVRAGIGFLRRPLPSLPDPIR